MSFPWHDTGLEGLANAFNLATKFSVTILGVVVLAILSSLVTLYAALRVNMRLEEANWDDRPGCVPRKRMRNHRKEIIARIKAACARPPGWSAFPACLTLLLGGFLLWLFFYRVLFPLRGMVADAQLYRGDRHASDKGSEEDELRMMGNHLRNLMSDVSDTRSRLERSRNQLLVAEKLASVGKLAASVAHEIRNPLTAMKMWLFSIQEAVQGNADLGRKLGIISEEIARLESIVRDFLEFSRPRTLALSAARRRRRDRSDAGASRAPFPGREDSDNLRAPARACRPSWPTRPNSSRSC